MSLSRNKIMIHHSLTADSGTVSWSAIRRYHVDTNKWKDIGYHYGVELLQDWASGTYEALVGRPETWRAAACLEGNMNEHAIHVCCVGNFDDYPPQEALLNTLVRSIILPVIERYKISPDAIVGHRDYAHYKTCPGKKFNLDELRARVWRELGRTA